MENKIFEKISQIIDDYWKDFQENKKESYVVKNSIPIIWFGDIEKYMSSSNKLKIVTVALNPSVLEFKEKKSDVNNPDISLRFPDCTEIALDNEKLSDKDKISLYTSLNNYFENNPYYKWFNNFEKILNSLNATYGGEMNVDNISYENQAIHIDIFSAIATDPTWGKLKNNKKENICYKEGFSNLIKYLQPDIVLISVAHKTMLDSFKIDSATKFCERKYVTEKGVKKPSIKIMAYNVNNLLESGKNAIILFGRNFGGTVFGGMSDSWKKENIPEIKQKIEKAVSKTY